MYGKAIAIILAASFSAPAVPQQGAWQDPSGAQQLYRADWFSYNGDHDYARPAFDEYRHNHPDDLLVPIRLLYDHLFDSRTQKMSAAEYHFLLNQVSDAIARFKSLEQANTPCAGTDIGAIAGDSIDCDYIGAALYSFREVLLVKNERALWLYRNRTALREDDDAFFAHAHRSRSLQAKFLRGVSEYELSQSMFGFVTGDPRDEKDALNLLADAMERQYGPFADDIWFYVLRIEEQHPKDKDVRALIKRHPPSELIAHLHQYPGNRIIKEAVVSLPADSYESY